MKAYSIEFYKSGILTKKWRWRVTADNGRIIGASSQGYYNLEDCKENVKTLANSLGAYNEIDMVSFGKYLLSGERKNLILSVRDDKELPTDVLSQVYHADLENWKETFYKKGVD